MWGHADRIRATRETARSGQLRPRARTILPVPPAATADPLSFPRPMASRRSHWTLAAGGKWPVPAGQIDRSFRGLPHLMRPATAVDAEKHGEIPWSSSVIRRASRISSSVTATKSPPLSTTMPLTYG